MSTPATPGAPHMVPMSRLRQAFGDRLGPSAPTVPGQRATVEAVYEGAMRLTLQVIQPAQPSPGRQPGRRAAMSGGG